MSLLKTYGLTSQDLQSAQNKIKSQRAYLESNHIHTATGQVKSLLDISFSANHSPRYYAQLSNKINTIESLAFGNQHEGNFLTATLDGFWRDIHKGDYRRFQALSYEDQAKVYKSVPEDDERGYLRSKLRDCKAFSVKDLYNVLNFQMKRFTESYGFKKLKKHGERYSYIKTVEPHQDGVPHFHIMLFIPEKYRAQFQKDFHKAFPAPRNSKSLKGSSGQTHGFQWNIQNASAYILKYITKSFLDVKKQNDLDYMQAWYLKHRITRVSTSRNLIPQWVYQKLLPLESDWRYVTSLHLDEDSHCEWSKEDDTFHFIDSRTKKELFYDRGLYRVLYDGRIVNEFGEQKERSIKKQKYESVPTRWSNKLPKGFNFNRLKNEALGIKSVTVPSEMSTLDLYTYYNNLDALTCNLDHYAAVNNILVDRGFIDGPRLTGSLLRLF